MFLDSGSKSFALLEGGPANPGKGGSRPRQGGGDVRRGGGFSSSPSPSLEFCRTFLDSGSKSFALLEGGSADPGKGGHGPGGGRGCEKGRGFQQLPLPFSLVLQDQGPWELQARILSI